MARGKGDNIYVTVPITVPEAALGAKIEVPTVEGKAQLRIPPGTQSGQKFRLRQRGAPSLRNPGAHGDQFVEVQVTLPKVISEETKELLRQYGKMNSDNPRVEMGLETSLIRRSKPKPDLPNGYSRFTITIHVNRSARPRLYDQRVGGAVASSANAAPL